MLRVSHLPAHLAYATMLADQDFAPVPSPTGTPLTAAQLVDLASWDFFNVLHVHTVELASVADLERLYEMAQRRGMRLVLTVTICTPTLRGTKTPTGRS